MRVEKRSTTLPRLAQGVASADISPLSAGNGDGRQRKPRTIMTKRQHQVIGEGGVTSSLGLDLIRWAFMIVVFLITI